MTAYFDFDGTLVDVWERYYKILTSYLSLNGYKCGGTIENYKYEKLRSAKDHLVAETLWNARMDIDDYLKYKRDMLETDELLQLDRPIGDFAEMAEKLRKKSCGIVLLSLRRKPEMLHKELERLGYADCFDETVVLNPENGKKTEWLVRKVKKGDILVGDSLDDLKTHINGVNAFFVKTGLHMYDETALRKNGITTIKDYTEILGDLI